MSACEEGPSRGRIWGNAREGQTYPGRNLSHEAIAQTKGLCGSKDNDVTIFLQAKSGTEENGSLGFDFVME